MRAAAAAILVAASVGVVAGLALAATRTTGFRAQASFVVVPAERATDPGLRTLVRTAAGLVASRSVVDNARTELHLDASDDALARSIRTHVSPGTAIVSFTVERPTATGAEQFAQQLLTAFVAVADARLPRVAGSPAVAVFDSANGSARRAGKPWLRDGILGLVAGLLVGAVLALLRRKKQEPGSPEPEAAVLLVEPDPPPTHEGRARLQELERLAAAEPDPRRAEELAIYLEQLRPLVGADGTLPPSLESLVENVFGAVGGGEPKSIL